MTTVRSVFQLIDLDRTLFDTAAFTKAVTDEVELLEPGVGQHLEALFEAAYLEEKTFFVLRHLRQTHGDAWFEALVDRVVQKHGAETFKLPGMDERLVVADEVSDLRPSWGLFTYGDAVDQYMKMRIIGLESAPVVFTPTPDKGEILKTWKHAGSGFQLPNEFGGGLATELTFEDDKLRAFTHLPNGVQGYWITSDPYAKERLYMQQQAGSISKDVEIVTGLQEIITTLKNS